MKRVQLYLDDDLWDALHAHARKQGTSISNLLREAARECYLSKLNQRREAMLALIGIRKDLPESFDSVQYERSLRRDTRMRRLREK